MTPPSSPVVADIGVPAERRPQDRTRGTVLLLRKPLLLLLFLGCAASVLTSGVFTSRLIVDGAVSFAFVPVCEGAGVAAAWARWRSRLPYSHAVDRLFDHNLPWLFWLLGLAAVGAFVPVRVVMGGWLAPMLLSALLPAGWSAWLDYRFCRQLPGARVPTALGDVLLMRAVAWPLAFMYFFGAIFFSDVVPTVAGWFGR